MNTVCGVARDLRSAALRVRGTAALPTAKDPLPSSGWDCSFAFLGRERLTRSRTDGSVPERLLPLTSPFWAEASS